MRHALISGFTITVMAAVLVVGVLIMWDEFVTWHGKRMFDW